jgi:hypothetical protein
VSLPRGAVLRAADGQDTTRRQHRRCDGPYSSQHNDALQNAPLLPTRISACSSIAYCTAPLGDERGPINE